MRTSPAPQPAQPRPPSLEEVVRFGAKGTEDLATLSRRAVKAADDTFGPAAVLLLAGDDAVPSAERLVQARYAQTQTHALALKLGLLGTAGGLLVGGAIALAGGPVGAVLACAIFGGAAGGGALMQDFVSDAADVKQAHAELLDTAAQAVEAKLHQS